MKVFVIFYLMFGLLTPSAVKAWQNGEEFFGNNSSWLERGAMIALITLLLAYPVGCLIGVRNARKRGDPVPNECAKGFLICGLSYIVGLACAFIYKV